MYITFAEEEKAKEIKDENKIKALVDTLMMVYDQRIEYFNQEGFVMAEKGKNLFLLNPAGFIDAYKYLGRAMELDGNSVLTTTPYYYMYTASLMFKNKKIDIDQLLKGFESSMSICEYNIAQGDKVDKWKKIIDNILQLIGPLLPEDTLLPFLDKKYDVVKDNLENINLYLKIMSMNRFIDNPVFMKYSERAHKLNPSALSAYNLGNAWYGNEDYSKSVDYYKQATELLTDEDDNLTKAQYHMSLAEAYRKSNNYPAARASAQKAAAANPDDGTPYMFIGGLYASSAKSCGEGNSFKQNAVYWIAVDMYKIAQSKGVADAGTQVVKLRKFFPTKEEAFYVDPPVKDGDDYKIDCWINGSTKARFFE